MLEQLTKIFDENYIKYSVNRKTINDKEYIYISVGIDISTDTKNEEDKKSTAYKNHNDIIDFTLWFQNEKDVSAIAISVHEVLEIPKEIRQKVKNCILDYNTTSIVGAFGIRTSGKYVEFNSVQLFTYGKDGQANEIELTPTLLTIIAMKVKEIREKIISMVSD